MFAVDALREPTPLKEWLEVMANRPNAPTNRNIASDSHERSFELETGSETT